MRAKDVVIASHHRVKFCKFGNLVSYTLTNDLNTLSMFKSYALLSLDARHCPLTLHQNKK